jgi:hypothetical protein
MRLLNTRTIQLEEFIEKTPPYAILSHTWGKDEVLFQDLKDPSHTAKAGYIKIKETCRIALDSGLRYAWVDTCCIDKSSSTELSEAINSMFQWYQDAKICYAFLADVDPISTLPKEPCSAFGKSRWFRRGWTLQELLAPQTLVFYASDWSPIASRADVYQLIGIVTGIDNVYLVRPPGIRFTSQLEKASVAQRMSWAAQRQTTRTEDIAYCLLGLFGINMPLLYGERRRAFARLQEEILRRFDDQSIFAFNNTSGSRSFLATSPADFLQSGHIIPCKTGSHTSSFKITNRGLVFTLPMLEDHALLECRPRNDPTSKVVVRLESYDFATYQRRVNLSIGLVNYKAWNKWRKKTIRVRSNLFESWSTLDSPILDLTVLDSLESIRIRPFLIRALSPDIVIEGCRYELQDRATKHEVSSLGEVLQPVEGILTDPSITEELLKKNYKPGGAWGSLRARQRIGQSLLVQRKITFKDTTSLILNLAINSTGNRYPRCRVFLLSSRDQQKKKPWEQVPVPSRWQHHLCENIHTAYFRRIDNLCRYLLLFE